MPARWLSLPDGRAVVEAAAAIGLPLLARSERDPLRASSRGLGELLLAVLVESPASVVVGLGGSATVDGGAGMRECVRGLPVPTVVLCDVRTRLATPRGCSVLRRVRPKRASQSSSAASTRWTSSGRLPISREPAPQVDSGRHSRRSEQISYPEPRSFSTSSASTKLFRATISSSRARGRSTRRPPRERRRARSRDGAWRAGVRCVVFGGRVRAEISGAETIALSGERDHAEADLVDLGRRLAA